MALLKFGGKLDVVGSVAGAKKKAKGPFRVQVDGEDVTIFNETNPATGGASFHGGAKVKPGSNTISIVAIDSACNRDMSVRHVTFPPTNPQPFQYDRNGNQLSDGRWNYTWDEENRLTSVESASSADKKIRVVFAYDGMSRRSSKTVYNWISNAWSEIENRKFIYDGWNLISEVGRTVPGEPSTHRIEGQINLNPNNSPQNEFVLTLTNGGTIMRDNLTKDFAGYSGPAASIHIKPKGSGKQGGLMVDGQAYELLNAEAYEIASAAMTVRLYNDRIDKKGKALGHWWIEIAATGATITVDSRSEIPTLTSTNFYIWGLDLSGTLQGAGGVGGLLAATLSTNNVVYSYDGNGNVSELIDSAGAIAAHYEYSPFGQEIVSVGPLAKENKFRFSTKYFDDETGLYYYGFRYYSPSLERWLSRDPIGELRGINIYCFANNRPTFSYDKLGLFCITYSTTDNDNYKWFLEVSTDLTGDPLYGYKHTCNLYKTRDVIRHQFCLPPPCFRDVNDTEYKLYTISGVFTDGELNGYPPPLNTPQGYCDNWAKDKKNPDPPDTW